MHIQVTYTINDTNDLRLDYQATTENLGELRPHLIEEFRTIGGVTPRALLSELDAAS